MHKLNHKIISRLGLTTSIRELNGLPDEDMEGPWQPAEAHLHKRKRMQLDAVEVPRAARRAPSEEI